MLDLKRLVALQEVARLKSFSAAAMELSLTQSAVSQQVAALEKQLGITLLDRGPPIVLTKPGELLVERTAHALAHLSSAEAEIIAFRGLKTGRLRISAFASAASGIMPEALRRFHELHAEVQVSLLQMEPHAGVDAVRRGEVDIALGHRYSIEPDLAAPLALRQQYLFDEDVLVAMREDHRFAGEEQVWLRDLADDMWIDAVNAGVPLELLAQAATAVGFQSMATYEGDDFATILQLVSTGAGVALVPELAIRDVPENLVFIPVAPNGLKRAIQAVTLDTGIASPATLTIFDILVQLGAEMRRQRTGRRRGGSLWRH
jgi:DNA-binding transcriptional LysR family regulator